MADETVQLKTLQTILIIFQSQLQPANEVTIILEGYVYICIYINMIPFKKNLHNNVKVTSYTMVLAIYDLCIVLNTTNMYLWCIWLEEVLLKFGRNDLQVWFFIWNGACQLKTIHLHYEQVPKFWKGSWKCRSSGKGDNMVVVCYSLPFPPTTRIHEKELEIFPSVRTSEVPRLHWYFFYYWLMWQISYNSVVFISLLFF